MMGRDETDLSRFFNTLVTFIIYAFLNSTEIIVILVIVHYEKNERKQHRDWNTLHSNP